MIDASVATCIDIDPSAVALDHMPRSVSCTPSCRGCDDPECGYCDGRIELTREQRVDAEREKILRSARDMNTLIDGLYVDGYGGRIAEAARLFVEHEDLAGGDILRDLLKPRIAAEAERRAA